MRELTFDQFRKVNVARCIDGFKRQINDWTPTDWATAMAGECGEACNIIKKMRRLANVPEDVTGLTLADQYKYSQLELELADELSDLVTYVDLLAARFQIKLSKAVVSKFNEVSDRVNSTIKL